MIDEKVNNLPPIISSLIFSLRDKRNTIAMRDNYCGTIENIIQICSNEVAQFKKEQTKANYDIRNTKKRKSNG